MRNVRRWGRVLLVWAVSMLLVSCAQSPTGRNQFLMYSPDQMSQMGYQAFNELKQQLPQSDDPEVVDYVHCVTRSLLSQTPPIDGVSNWEVVVFDQGQINAFALPGGKIGVFTGLLEVAETPDQLAAVIGHEIAHVQARHANERISRAQMVNLGFQIASLGIGNSSNAVVWQQAMGLGFQVGVMLPYSRLEESEADAMGLSLMAKSGFDPEASIELWYNMAKYSQGAPPELLSTHPSHETRIDDLAARYRAANSLYLKAQSAGIKPNCIRPDSLDEPYDPNALQLDSSVPGA